MNDRTNARPYWATAVALLLVFFGVLTIISGGQALFGSDQAQAAVGDAVPFVLWFNFAAGFFYVLASIGIYRWQRWAAWLSLGIALATLLVFVVFGWHVANGQVFEMRTVAAMLLRSSVWTVVAVAAFHSLGCRSDKRLMP